MKGAAKARYTNLAIIREPFLQRARDCAELTIPSLLPPPGKTSTLQLPELYQSLGARCVNHISSKLMMALLPAGQRPFRYSIPPELLMKSENMTVPPEVERNLAKAEVITQSEIDRQGWRQPTNLALQLLVVTGNTLEYMTPDNKLRVFRLDQYVVVRDPVGNVLELITQEIMNPAALPQELQGLVDKKKLEDYTSTVELYTHVKKNLKGGWDVYQELEGKIVPKSKGEFEISPYNAYRWSIVPGEDYGRGKVEEHIGDFRSLEGLNKALVDGSAMASRNIILIRPNATSNLKKKIAEANNGDTVVGNVEDINMLQFQNTTGMTVAAQHEQMVRENLAAAFLLGSGAVRDAERVTATEIRQSAEELDGMLGGVYSMLSQDMQRPRLVRLILQMQTQNKLPAWPKGTVEPVITTGLEALGRERDIVRVNTAANLVASLGPEAQAYVKWASLLSKAFTALELQDSVRSDEEVAAMQQEQALAQSGLESLGAAAGQAAVAPQ